MKRLALLLALFCGSAQAVNTNLTNISKTSNGIPGMSQSWTVDFRAHVNGADGLTCYIDVQYRLNGGPWQTYSQTSGTNYPITSDTWTQFGMVTPTNAMVQSHPKPGRISILVVPLLPQWFPIP